MDNTIKSFTGSLEGEHVSLRSLSVEGCTQRYLSWLQDPDINQYLETRWQNQSLDTIILFVKTIVERGDSILFAIIEKKKGIHIGNLKIGPVDPNHRNADISYFIGEKDQWGKGYATEAIRLATEFGFKKLALHRLQAGVYATNTSSRRVLEKVGYEFEGAFKEALLGPQGWEDHLKFGLLKQTWEAKAAT